MPDGVVRFYTPPASIRRSTHLRQTTKYIGWFAGAIHIFQPPVFFLQIFKPLHFGVLLVVGQRITLSVFGLYPLLIWLENWVL